MTSLALYAPNAPTTCESAHKVLILTTSVTINSLQLISDVTGCVLNRVMVRLRTPPTSPKEKILDRTLHMITSYSKEFPIKTLAASQLYSLWTAAH